MQRNQSGFDLRHFVDVNFTLPKAGEKYVPPAGQSLREHIDGLWPVLTRSTKNVEKWDSLLPLPESYVVPGGRFREIYYWDSYFTMLGLAESGHWDKVADMVANFGYEIDAWGHIPNGNRTYYLSRSQPPFFAFMVELLAQHEGDDALKEYLPQLQKEYAYWMEGVETLQPGQQNQRVVKLEDGSVLNRYWDDRDTPALNPGLKISLPPKAPPTARQRRSIETSALPPPPAGISAPAGWIIRSSSVPSVPPRLSLSILTLCCISWKTLARASAAAGDRAKASQYDTLANARQKAIEMHLWNNKEGWYADYDLQNNKIRDQLTAAALFPLYVNAAAKDRAAKVAAAAQAHLLQPGGLATTSVKSGQQWDAPNGWAPLQWVAAEGLQNYGQDDVAMEVTWRFLTNVQHTYDREKNWSKNMMSAAPEPAVAAANIHFRTALAGPTA